ncbi:MAG: YceI family protein [Gammaproteobacteria bacterium]|nr:YceI family protein [Gammaproteobacteria bacterium]
MLRAVLRGHTIKLLIAAVLLTMQPAAYAADFKIDPAHSFVQFRIKHLGYSWLMGRFNDVSGSLTWDESTPTKSAINVTVATASIDTNHTKRDQHIKGEDFLEVDKFPTATFVSKAYEGSADAGTLSGDLSIHGVTRSVSFPVKRIGQGDDPWGGYRVGFEGTLPLTRADYGVTYNLGPTSTTMQLELFVEAIRAK